MTYDEDDVRRLVQEEVTREGKILLWTLLARVKEIKMTFIDEPAQVANLPSFDEPEPKLEEAPKEAIG